MCQIIRGEISEGRNVPLDLKGGEMCVGRNVPLDLKGGEMCVGRNVGHSFFFSQFLYFSSVL